MQKQKLHFAPPGLLSFCNADREVHITILTNEYP